MRRLLKFLHTLGAAGLIGGMAALAVMVVWATGSIGTSAYQPLIGAMDRIAAWVIGPSMVLTVIAGLLAIAASPGFQDAGWVWLKAATGVLVFEGGLHVLGPLHDEARRGVEALGGAPALVGAQRLLVDERNTLWVLLAVSLGNIALAIWRPRLPSIPV